MIYLIWAMTKEGYISKNNNLPWKIKEEMNYFKEQTINKTVLMGSKTFLSIKKPLINRKNIIITNSVEKYRDYSSEYCIISNDLFNILKEYSKNFKNELWVIGGSKIYEQAFSYADYLYVSIIKENYSGDLKFPITNFTDFKIIKEQDFEEFTTYIYQRKAK